MYYYYWQIQGSHSWLTPPSGLSSHHTSAWPSVPPALLARVTLKAIQIHTSPTVPGIWTPDSIWARRSGHERRSSRSRALPKRLTYFTGCRRGGGEGAALLDTVLLRHVEKIDGLPSSLVLEGFPPACCQQRVEMMGGVQLEVCQRQEGKCDIKLIK